MMTTTGDALLLWMYVAAAILFGSSGAPYSSMTSSCPTGCSCKNEVFASSASLSPVPCDACPSQTSSSLSSGKTGSVKCDGIGLDSIPDDMSPETTSLDLSRNHLIRIDVTSFAVTRKLVHLKLSQNRLLDIEDGSFHGLDSLQILDLDGNNLTSLRSATFAGAETILHLDVSGNRLERVDGAFSGLRDLSRLDLRNNQLTELTASVFKNLSNLRYLLLTSNRIRHIDRRAFRHLEKLVYIVLKKNPIGNHISRFQFHSQSLTYVDLSECEFSEVPKGFPGSTRYLQLRRNNISALSRSSFVECALVNILVLDENRISSIQDGTFQHLTQLQQLWLNNNRLDRVPPQLPSSIQRLLLDFNQVENITDVFPMSSKINTLSLMGNNLSNIADNSFTNLLGLKTLDLSNNKIQHINSNTFLPLEQLKILQLSNNPFQAFHARSFHGLTQLQTLSLAYVPTEVTIVDESFEDFVSLEKLDVDSSPGVVQTLLSSDRLLNALQGIQDLSMRSSDLVRIRSDFASFFPNLSVLHISSARWHCDRTLIWLRDWMLSTKIRIESTEENKCLTPRGLHGLQLLSLDDTDFAKPGSDSGADSELYRNIGSGRSTKRFSEEQESDGFMLSRPTTSPSNMAETEHDRNTRTVSTTDAAGDEFLEYQFHPFPGLEDRFDDSDFRLNARSSISYQSKPITSFPGVNTDKIVDDTDDNDSHDDDDVDISQLDIRTLATVRLNGSAVQTGSNSDNETSIGNLYSAGRIALVVATLVITIVVAIVIIVLICHFSRDFQSPKPKPEQNGISPTIHMPMRNGTLHYKSSMSSVRPEVVICSKESLQKTSSSGEIMTLIPGRDINHEGPLRVYKWEDF